MLGSGILLFIVQFFERLRNTLLILLIANFIDCERELCKIYIYIYIYIYREREREIGWTK